VPQRESDLYAERSYQDRRRRRLVHHSGRHDRHACRANECYYVADCQCLESHRPALHRHGRERVCRRVVERLELVHSQFRADRNIKQVAVCNLSSCGSHAMAYRLYVSLNDPAGGNNLRQVTFTATTVPNGTDYDYTTCATGTSRTPTASSFSATDSGGFECSFDCSQTGATVSLTYN
jgi:hypothetical protein